MSEGTNAERITANNNIISANNSDIDAIKLRISNLPDTSVATATAGDIASGKTAFVNGQMVTGSYTPPTVSLQSKDVTITENGTTTIEPDSGYDGLSDVDVTVNVSGPAKVPERDVNFYDYDGTVVASYTASDFANLSALPNNPTHTGLTSQGWNWTLADAKTYVASYGKLNIGQMYVTDDGATRIYIKLEEGRLEPYLGFAINGTATVDWGDNTTSTVTGSDTTTIIYTQHTYASAGEYVISISSESIIYFRGTNANGSSLLVKTSGNSDDSIAYQTTIHKIEFSSNVKFENYAFKNCYSLSNVTIPFTDCGIGINAFQYCYSLLNIILPNKRMSISTGAFQHCYSLSNVILPDTISNFNNGVFQYCYSLSFIAIPRNNSTLPSNLLDSCYSLSDIALPVVSVFNDSSILANCRSLSKIKLRGTRQIGVATFLNCKSLKYCDLSSATSIPTLGLNAFNGIPSDCKIVVPDSLYEDWIVANNWSTYASYIIKASDWT